jgi:hypothetical protein
MIEAATSIVQENQVIKDTRRRRSRWTLARLLVAPFVVVICLTECVEICAVAIEVSAVVGDVLFQIWHLGIWITDVRSNA